MQKQNHFLQQAAWSSTHKLFLVWSSLWLVFFQFISLWTHLFKSSQWFVCPQIFRSRFHYNVGDTKRHSISNLGMKRIMYTTRWLLKWQCPKYKKNMRNEWRKVLRRIETLHSVKTKDDVDTDACLGMKCFDYKCDCAIIVLWLTMQAI